MHMFIHDCENMKVQARVAQITIDPCDLNSDVIIRSPKFDTDDFKNKLKQIDENVVNESNSKSNDNENDNSQISFKFDEDECTGE